MKKAKLFGIPFGGGTRYSLNFLQKTIPEHIEFVAIELPGRGSRIDEVLLNNVFEIADDIYEQTEQTNNSPYALFGHCMGALLALLVARKATTNNLNPPIHLFVSGCVAPDQLSKIQSASISEFDIRETLVEFGTPIELANNQSFLEMIEPIFRADYHAFNNYTYQKYKPLTMPITVIIEKDDLISLDEANKWQRESIYPIKIFNLSNKLSFATTELIQVFSIL